eukprot:2003290-Amphidinium_carterae.1
MPGMNHRQPPVSRLGIRAVLNSNPAHNNDKGFGSKALHTHCPHWKDSHVVVVPQREFNAYDALNAHYMGWQSWEATSPPPAGDCS